MRKNKLRKGLVVAIIVLFFGASVITSMGRIVVERHDSILYNLDRNILYVGGSGPGNYTKIQDAIDNASSGDTIFVFNGTYYENVVINKSINLVGEDKNNTIIDGGYNDYVIQVIEDLINISGFTIKNCKNSPTCAGMNISSDSCTIEDNKIISNIDGIFLQGVTNVTISNNTIMDNKDEGIIFYDSCNNTITGNLIDDNGQDDSGIAFVNSSHIEVSANTITNNTYHGIVIYDSSNNKIIGNTIRDNDVQGIRLEQSSFNIISDNEVTENLDDGIALNYDSNNNTVINSYIAVNVDDGIQIYESNNNLILKNEIIENIETGIQITENSNNNQLYHNNILNNTLQANDLCNSFWDNGYPSGGNYWDDYTGNDLYSGPNQDIPGPDGIGDTSYNISGGDSQDHYPLMHHFELYYILNISAPSEVNEGELFNVVVTSMGGPVVPLATVEFNDELKSTDSDGRVYFTAPQVSEDTYYDVIASKDHYIDDSENILVKDVPVEFVSVFMFGRITNLNVTGEYITFEAVNVRLIKFSPFQFLAFTSGEPITILKDYTGLLGALFGVQFIFATCDASIG